MGYRVLLAKGADIYDIAGIAGGISWGDSVDSLGAQMDFSVAFSADPLFPKLSVEVGDIVVLKNAAEVFRGIIVTQSLQPDKRSFTAFDFCWYLNKSKLIKQFNGINAGVAIGRLCAELNIEVGGISPMRSDVNHIYYDKTAAEIIGDILTRESEMTGSGYLVEMRGGNLYVFERTSITVEAWFKPADNIAAFDASAAIAHPSRTLSIEDMRNSVLVVSGSEQSVRTLAEAADEPGIKKYGLLQEVLAVDEAELGVVRNIAENKLSELNRIRESVSVSLPGDDAVRAGRVLALNEPTTGIAGRYLIKSCNHSLSGGVHTMDLELEAV